MMLVGRLDSPRNVVPLIIKLASPYLGLQVCQLTLKLSLLLVQLLYLDLFGLKSPRGIII